MRERGFEFDEINYVKQPLDEATVRSLVKAAGGVGRVLNVRHASAKERGWTQDHPPPEAEFVRAAVAEPNLLRRPILVGKGMVLVGYDRTNQEQWARLR